MKAIYECDNCRQQYEQDDLKEIDHLAIRLDPGGPVPAGECPDRDCGALCYPVEHLVGLEGTTTHVITNGQLAALVGNILTNPFSGEVDDTEAFARFCTEIAEVVCNYCGGEIASPAQYAPAPGNMDWATHYRLLVDGNAASREGGGVWGRALATAEQAPSASPTQDCNGELPTVVIEMNGSAIYCGRSNVPLRIVLLDENTEGAEQNRIMKVNDDEVYVRDFVLSQFVGRGQDGVDPGFVAATVEQLDGGAP